MDQRCRESEGKVKIEGYMSVSDEEAHQHQLISNTPGFTLHHSRALVLLTSLPISNGQATEHLLLQLNNRARPGIPVEQFTGLFIQCWCRVVMRTWVFGFHTFNMKSLILCEMKMILLTSLLMTKNFLGIAIILTNLQVGLTN